jgi:purine-binding chemotaxis protein CheW
MPQALLPFFASVAEQSAQRALARQRLEASPQAPTELLGFSLGDEQFALPLGQVLEICRVSGLTAVPRTGPETLGIMSLRGEVVPVANLAAILGLAVAAHPKDKMLRIILLADGRGPLGLQVCQVRGVMRLLPQDVVPRPFGHQGRHPELVTGLARTGRGPVTLLDGALLLRHLERLP